MIGPATIAYALTLAAPESRSRIYARVFAGFTLAPIVAMPAAATLAITFHWRLTFVVLAGLAAVTACAVLFVLRAPQRSPTVPIRMHQLPAGLGIILGTTLLQVAARFVPFTLLSGLLTEQFHVSETWLPLALLFFAIGGFAGNLFGGWCADRYGQSRTIISSTTLLTLCFIGLTAGWSPTVAVVLVVVAGVLSAMFAPAQQIVLASRLRPEHGSFAAALNTSSQAFGMLFGSTLGGLGLWQAGYGALFVIAASLTAVVVVAALYTHRSSGSHQSMDHR
jgi:DHA1 family inner membrane transport protein